MGDALAGAITGDGEGVENADEPDDDDESERLSLEAVAAGLDTSGLELEVGELEGDGVPCRDSPSEFVMISRS
jgi:hypothetical protein